MERLYPLTLVVALLILSSAASALIITIEDYSNPERPYVKQINTENMVTRMHVILAVILAVLVVIFFFMPSIILRLRARSMEKELMEKKEELDKKVAEIEVKEEEVKTRELELSEKEEKRVLEEMQKIEKNKAGAKRHALKRTDWGMSKREKAD